MYYLNIVSFFRRFITNHVPTSHRVKVMNQHEGPYIEVNVYLTSLESRN